MDCDNPIFNIFRGVRFSLILRMFYKFLILINYYFEKII